MLINGHFLSKSERSFTWLNNRCLRVYMGRWENLDVSPLRHSRFMVDHGGGITGAAIQELRFVFELDATVYAMSCVSRRAPRISSGLYSRIGVVCVHPAAG